MRPTLTQASSRLTVDVEATNEHGISEPVAIAAERPLTLYIDKREIVTLMTLGAQPEMLTLGYLRNQRLVKDISDISSVQVDWECDSVAVVTRNGIADLDGRMEKRTVTTGCGQGTVFGAVMDEIEAIKLTNNQILTQPTLYALLDNVRVHDTIYKSAGAVHGCALADKEGKILTFVEDVGRHNAVDAIAGWMWLENISGHDKIFYTTGRLTSEMVIKAAQMGIPFLVSRSGLTQMGHEIAQKIGITMIGRAVNKHYLLFT
ncbi:MAG: formate dehydrogenase accessory sulfurtransferase FdhD, partial [Burkholderiales bacterium]